MPSVQAKRKRRKSSTTLASMSPIRTFVEETRPNTEYYLLVTGGALIALIGILLDNLVVLIASMIVAPLLQPILAAGYGIVRGSWRDVWRAVLTFVISLLVVLAVTLVGLFFLRSISVPLDERVFISFAPEPISAIVIAVFGGMFATLGIFSKRIESIVIGVGLAVSLMPPLVAIGIGALIGWGTLFSNAAVIFGLNVLGILVGSIAMFLIMRANAFGLRRHLED